MRKLACRNCGNTEVFAAGAGENQCKCGWPLIEPSDYRSEMPSDIKLQAALMMKINLLKRDIDQCLDDRDEERFNKLSYELKVCQRYLETRTNSRNPGRHHSTVRFQF